jgi:hypothetical protein
LTLNSFACIFSEEPEEESNHSPPAKPEDIMLDEKSTDELFDEDEESDEV